MRMVHGEAPSSPISRLLSAIRGKRERRLSEPVRQDSKRARKASSALKEWRSELALFERPSDGNQSVDGSHETVFLPMTKAWPSPCNRTRRMTMDGEKSTTPSSTPSATPLTNRRRSLSDLDDFRRLAVLGRLGRPFERGTPLRRSKQANHLPTCKQSFYEERVLVVGSQRDTRIRFPSRCGPALA